MADDLLAPRGHFLDGTRIVESLGLPVIATTPGGTIVAWNRAAESVYGHAAASAVGRNVVDLLVPLPLGARAAELMESMAAGESWSGEFVVNRADGAAVRIHAVNTPVLDERGRVIGIVGVGRDITGQVVAEQEQLDSRNVCRLALSAGRLGTWQWDIATGSVRWDEQLEAIFGLPPGGFDGSFDMYQSLLHPEDRGSVLAKVHDAVAEKSDYDVEHRVVWPDGTAHWLQGRGSVTLDRHGKVTGTVGCVADITERVQRWGQAAEMSVSLQAGLLPHLPEPPGLSVLSRYRPGEERLLLGGDFIDVAVTPCGNVAFCIGDVSGRGAVAAAVGASLRAAWRALALTGDDPTAWLAGCCDVLATSDPPVELFVTIATGFVSADRRRLVVLSAGHPFPILLSGGVARTLGVDTHPPLGLLSRADINQPAVIDLPSEWTLFMFTDGLFEGHAAPGAPERLGVERIAQWCLDHQGASVDIGHLDDLLEFVQGANGGPIDDDIALLVIAPSPPGD